MAMITSCMVVEVAQTFERELQNDGDNMHILAPPMIRKTSCDVPITL
jgi:hypothetical protein